MATAIALPGFNDLGLSLTPSYLSNLLHHVVDAVYTEPLFPVPDNCHRVFQFWVYFCQCTFQCAGFCFCHFL